MMSNEYRFKDNSENMDGLRKLVLFGADKEKNNRADKAIFTRNGE